MKAELYFVARSNSYQNFRPISWLYIGTLQCSQCEFRRRSRVARGQICADCGLLMLNFSDQPPQSGERSGAIRSRPEIKRKCIKGYPDVFRSKPFTQWKQTARHMGDCATDK